MIRTLWGDIRAGRLQRLPYLGYTLLLIALLFLISMSIALIIGAAEEILGGDLEQAQLVLSERFNSLAIVTMMTIGGLFIFADLNITAKRARDAGLPGWWFVLAVLIFSALLSAVLSPQAGSGVHAVVWLALVLIPTGLFARSADDERGSKHP